MYFVVSYRVSSTQETYSLVGCTAQIGDVLRSGQTWLGSTSAGSYPATRPFAPSGGTVLRNGGDGENRRPRRNPDAVFYVRGKQQADSLIYPTGHSLSLMQLALEVGPDGVRSVTMLISGGNKPIPVVQYRVTIGPALWGGPGVTDS